MLTIYGVSIILCFIKILYEKKYIVFKAVFFNPNLRFLHFSYIYLCFIKNFSAKCREKNTSKFKRSLKLAISSDDINIRHKAGLRKIFRRKRDIKDENEIEGKLKSKVN